MYRLYLNELNHFTIDMNYQYLSFQTKKIQDLTSDFSLHILMDKNEEKGFVYENAKILQETIVKNKVFYKIKYKKVRTLTTCELRTSKIANLI